MCGDDAILLRLTLHISKLTVTTPAKIVQQRVMTSSPQTPASSLVTSVAGGASQKSTIVIGGKPMTVLSGGGFATAAGAAKTLQMTSPVVMGAKQVQVLGNKTLQMIGGKLVQVSGAAGGSGQPAVGMAIVTSQLQQRVTSTAVTTASTATMVRTVAGTASRTGTC